ncbi:MAG: Gnt-II system L-idonate transporter [Phycisphaera sp.]|nr:Gnt-II system L-idonate transporter [Phycisphaera sp.]
MTRRGTSGRSRGGRLAESGRVCDIVHPDRIFKRGSDFPLSTGLEAGTLLDTVPMLLAQAADTASKPQPLIHPMGILAIAIVIVIGMIVWLRINAFIALITGAIVISLLAPGEWALKIERVAQAFGGTAAGIGIVIALAAVIGKAMMDSGAADRVVKMFLDLLGEKRSGAALLASGYTLSIPVFFDTAFYLLVPLARSLYRRTKHRYLYYLVAIAAGGAITHTLVPPTPGPLFIANQLGVDLGVMIGIGALVAVPGAIAGLIFAGWINKRMPIEMRPYAGEEERETEQAIADAKLPNLMLALAPILLPIVLITANSIVKVVGHNALEANPSLLNETPAAKFVLHISAADAEANPKLAGHDGKLGVIATSKSGKKYVQAMGDGDITNALLAVSHKLPIAKTFGATNLVGNPNFALLLSAGIAVWTLWLMKKPTKEQMAETLEHALMSGGIIILITAAGGAFGGMLKAAELGAAIENMFGSSATKGLPLLFFAFGIASLIKFAQGSSTAAMIVTSGMIVAMITPESLTYHPVYLALAIGNGSLIGSWMNDSGFWIFAKMGALTEAEALKSWTPLLVVLGVTGMITTVLLAVLMPMT